MDGKNDEKKYIRVTNHGMKEIFGFPIQMIQVEEFTEADARREYAKEKAAAASGRKGPKGDDGDE